MDWVKIMKVNHVRSETIIITIIQQVRKKVSGVPLRHQLVSHSCRHSYQLGGCW